MNDNEHNNFSLGFVVGALVGVAGYFFTRTQEGKEIKKKITSEWSTIRKKLEDEGVIPEDGKDFSDIIVSVRTKLYEFLGEEGKFRRKKGWPGSLRSKIEYPGVKPGRKITGASSKLSEVSTKSLAKKRKRMFKGI
ncbi:MAG: hypothetical protein COZ34_00960 [Candidatus Pacebacteria bacterium CG_4_10_14_3_um_filter_34_15]|nr:YtxH domain-containing protein [Candidatus Pacearchaeota archaeon]NCQ65232.1 YtxH domain-containing protein [Candidatus Paceibacterota bacterium]OIO45041.1 MAG: hypothetical protein AUJ41_01245 [Candidatus Pacebacteria bacterium CG1_02_43_31]PIQ81011.1 MAG: hypothetical protein COV78_02315 [Candidatus Pacebacteria bacterium CG11_big_fil_rev_8_21_14_0_20_34_55]PIX81828.1 MAG: hypothetical protein COZ34_00960 [Candidatus Pacebacteria bacterium CG_4_10_14_3_um_filter_34_15]PJC44044.1 MAG: hypo